MLQRALAVARRWERRSYVVGTAIGQRQRQGRFRSAAKERCIVVYVDQKLPLAELRASRRARFPGFIEVTLARRKQRVPVDVQATGAQVGQLQGLVSSRVSIGGLAVGAVGGVVENGRGQQYVLVAGHVARDPGRRLQLVGGVSVVTSLVRMSSLLDHALARAQPSNELGDASLPSGDVVAGVRAVDAELLGERVFFQRAATGKRVSTLVRSIDASAAFPLPHHAGPVFMRGLIATRADTQFGDSGTLLYDSGFGALGTLVGTFGEKSYFVPCDTAFARLNITLVEDPT